jgi:hypothetical protein
MSKNTKRGSQSSSSGKKTKDTIFVDPSTIRFTHARIRPFFTGCGKRIEDTIQEIIDGKVSVTDLPLISVIENDGDLFSLNNRRLYVFKYIQTLGLLPNNTIECFSKPALEREKKRYIASRCALQAKIMMERDVKDGGNSEGEGSGSDTDADEPPGSTGDAIAAALASCQLTATNEVVEQGNTSTSNSASGATGANCRNTCSPATPVPALPVAAAPPVPAASKAAPKKISLPAAVTQQAIQELAKLVSKGKHKAVTSQLDEWLLEGTVTSDQLDHIAEMVGMPVTGNAAGSGKGKGKGKGKGSDAAGKDHEKGTKT